jgi:ABC-type dipeptide/oligopeptide/nickel transport system permease component
LKQLPLSYIARNLWVRRVTTALTALGLALVVYVFATVLMMSEGIKTTWWPPATPAICWRCARARGPRSTRA